MKKYVALVLALACVLCLAGCAGRSGGTTPSEHKSFKLGNVSTLTVISVDGKRFEATDTDTVQQITDNIESIQFEKGESSEDTNGFGPFIQWYDINDNLIESISVMGEETIIYDGAFWTATDGNIDVGLLGRVLAEALEETVTSFSEELDIDYTTNDDGTYTCGGNIYKHKIEVSGIEGESQVTFIVLTNDIGISFEEVSYSLKKAEISAGVPEFVILGWH